MDDFRELDTVLSGPIFHNLTHVIVRVLIYSDRSAVQDEDSAHGLTLCLPMLDARGILGCVTSHLVHSTVSLTMCILIAYSGITSGTLSSSPFHQLADTDCPDLECIGTK